MIESESTDIYYSLRTYYYNELVENITRSHEKIFSFQFNSSLTMLHFCNIGSTSFTIRGWVNGTVKQETNRELYSKFFFILYIIASFVGFNMICGMIMLIVMHICLNNRNEKKMIVAYLLWCFFGFFGAHRFYLNRNVSGTLFLFTYGLFGFGWLIDFFIIRKMVRIENHKLV